MKPTPSKMRDVPPLSTKQNMLWNSAGSMTYLACQWLVTVLVVRLSAGYDDAGLLSLAMSVVGIFGTFANYKMGTYQISDIRRENDLAEYLGFRCLTLGLAFVACMVYAYLTCAPYALATIALFFVFKAVGLLIDILHGADQQHRRMDYIGKSFIAQGLSTLAAFVAVFWFTRNLNLAIVGMTASALGVLVLFDIPKAGQFERVCLRLSRSKALFFLKVSFPAVLASLAASAIFAIPKQYLAMTSGDAALGIYASVAAPALVIQMGAMYLYGPLLDVFPRHFFDGDLSGFLKLLGKTIGGIVLVGIACSIVLELVGSWALQLLFGSSIEPYVYLLQPIILSTILTAFLWFFGDLLITLRNFKANFIGNIVALVSVLAVTFPFVNLWDMNGVSFAGAVACLAGVLTLLGFLIATVRRGPARAHGGNGERTDG
ncbi:MAG: lipopolysaccharide biosynthesis protein [Eggerthella lenta]